MAAIIYENFGGLVPKLNARNLPPGMAQRAHNVEMSGRKLAPLDMTEGFDVQHNPEGGAMYGQIPEAQLFKIPEPDKPTLIEANRLKILYPELWNWIIHGKVFMEWFENGIYYVEDVGFNSFVLTAIEYTDEGFLVKVYLGPADRTLKQGLYYKIYGPKFGFDIDGDNGYRGGPENNVTAPDPLVITNTSPNIPYVSIPLTAPLDYSDFDGDPTKEYTGVRYTYGKLQLIDVSGPVAIPEWDGTQATSDQKVNLTDAGTVTFFFRCNYNRQKQQFVRYVTQGEDYRIATAKPKQSYGGTTPATVEAVEIDVDPDTLPEEGEIMLLNDDGLDDVLEYDSFSYDSGTDTLTFSISGGTLRYSYYVSTSFVLPQGDVARLGPISDVSDDIVVERDEILKLSTPRPGGCKGFRIYRTQGGDFRELEDEIVLPYDVAAEDAYYYDTFLRALDDPIPPYGNYPHDTKEEALEGSMYLGGRIGLLIDGEELRPSEPYELHVYPEEYAFSLYAPIMAGVGFMSSAIIWTDTSFDGIEGRVYRVGGQHPRYWSSQQLTNCKPLLNKRSIGVIDQTAFYVSNDGIMAVSAGGQVVNITEAFFNREQWLEYDPFYYSCYTRDDSLFFVHLNDGVNFRIDLNDGHCRLTTFDGFNNGDIEYRGRIEEAARPISFRAVQVEADGFPVSLRLIGDGGYADETVLLPDDRAQMLPRMRRCKEWEVAVQGRSTITRVAVATSVQELTR